MVYNRPALPLPIEPSQYEEIVESDYSIYPTTNGISVSTLEKWYQYHPEFGMIYPSYGYCITVALKPQVWDLLLRGEIMEGELSTGIYNNEESEDGELAIHVYHMEKTSLWDRNFTRMGLVVLSDICSLLTRLNTQRTPRRPLKLVGFSGLTVTESGYSLFKNLYRCVDCPTYPTELIVVNTATNERKVVSNAHVDTLWQVVGETRMMAAKSPDLTDSLIIPILKQNKLM